MNQKGFNTKRMAVIALFCAIAYATMFVLRIKVSFLSFDAKDAVITIAAMLFGPGTGALISLIVATLELITVSDTGIYGWVMNFVSSAVFSMLASAIYRRSRKLSAASCRPCLFSDWDDGRDAGHEFGHHTAIYRLVRCRSSGHHSDASAPLQSDEGGTECCAGDDSLQTDFDGAQKGAHHGSGWRGRVPFGRTQSGLYADWPGCDSCVRFYPDLCA